MFSDYVIAILTWATKYFDAGINKQKFNILFDQTKNSNVKYQYACYIFLEVTFIYKSSGNFMEYILKESWSLWILTYFKYYIMQADFKQI